MTTRRQLLIGAGAYLLLRPFVDLHRARADEPLTPLVFVLAHKCQGLYPHNDTSKFVPRMSGGSLVFPTMLSSLAGYESQTTVVAGVDIPNFAGLDWHSAAPALYTGARIDGGDDNPRPRSPSIDQHIAARWGTSVRVTDAGYHPGFRPDWSGQAISWRQTPEGASYQHPVVGLRASFESLIGSAVTGGGMSTDEYERRARRGESLLDRYVGDVRALQAELPGDLGMRLESHVDGFREFERATFQGGAAGATTCDETGIDGAWREAPRDESGQEWIFRRAKLQAEMIAFAAACGLHRVFTYGFVDNNSSGLVPGEWRGDQKPDAYRGTDAGSTMMEHPGGRPARFDIGSCESDPLYHFSYWHCPPSSHELGEDYLFRYSFGYLVKQLDLRGVLPNALMLFGTTMSFNHSNEAHSFLLLGGAGGRHRGNRTLQFGPRFGGGSSLVNNHVLASVCQLLGDERDSFGDPEYGTGGVPGLV